MHRLCALTNGKVFYFFVCEVMGGICFCAVNLEKESLFCLFEAISSNKWNLHQITTWIIITVAVFHFFPLLSFSSIQLLVKTPRGPWRYPSMLRTWVWSLGPAPAAWWSSFCCLALLSSSSRRGELPQRNVCSAAEPRRGQTKHVQFYCSIQRSKFVSIPLGS